MDHLQRVVAHMQRHAILKCDDWQVWGIIFPGAWAPQAKRCHACQMLLHIGIQDARPDPFVGDDGHLEEGVTRPVIAVGFVLMI